MDLQLVERVALVCGAGGGLGRAIAAQLAAEGATVVGLDRDAGALATTHSIITAEGHRFRPMPVDLIDPAQVDTAVTTVERTQGPVTVLVNNTGGPPPGPIQGVPLADWRTHFTSMVAPVVHLTDRVLPGMRAAGWGRVITSASSGVVAPIPNLGLSNSLRSALVGWSKTLASEVAAHGITVNVVLPGRIATSRILELDRARAEREGRAVDEVAAASVSTIPVGRYGRPAEYGAVVAFLAGVGASFVNGSVVRVDGGMIASV